MKVKGLKKINKMLGKLGKKDAKIICKKALREAAKPLLSDIRSSVPVDTGTLKKAIKIKTWKRPKPGEIGVKIAPDFVKAPHANLIENGYVGRDGKFVAGKHYMLKGYKKHKSSAASSAIKNILKGIMNKVKGK